MQFRNIIIVFYIVIMGMVIFLQYVIVLTIVSNMLHNTNLIKYKTCSEKKKQYGVCISHMPKYWLHIILICCRMFVISFNVPVTIIKSIFCRLLISIRL